MKKAYIDSDVLRQLSYKPLIRVALWSIVPIMFPIIGEVILNLLSGILGEGPSLVEAGEEAEPLAQIGIVFVLGRHNFELHQHLDEVSHHKREHSHAKQNDNRPDDSFEVAYWAHITIADRGQRGKSEIYHLYHPIYQICKLDGQLTRQSNTYFSCCRRSRILLWSFNDILHRLCISTNTW